MHLTCRGGSFCKSVHARREGGHDCEPSAVRLRNYFLSTEANLSQLAVWRSLTDNAATALAGLKVLMRPPNTYLHWVLEGAFQDGAKTGPVVRALSWRAHSQEYYVDVLIDVA